MDAEETPRETLGTAEPIGISPDDVDVEVTVELGRITMTAAELLALKTGDAISLAKPLKSPMTLRAGGKTIGQGELVDIDGEIGVRIT